MIRDESKVILVDENNNETGIMDKMEAHTGAHLHRAISVFITDSTGNWLLQRRTKEKYHSKGLWSNTCCSHPAPGESIYEAASRRLMQEMGMKSLLTELFSFTYKAELENGLTEHETDHVFWGISDVLPAINHIEVMDYSYISYEKLNQDVENHPEKYSAWFKMIYQRVQEHIENQKNATGSI